MMSTDVVAKPINKIDVSFLGHLLEEKPKGGGGGGARRGREGAGAKHLRERGRGKKEIDRSVPSEMNQKMW